MTEKRTPIFTFTQRIGNTNFTVRAYCDDDIAVTYEDKLLELIESIQANDLLHPIVVWKQPDGAPVSYTHLRAHET